MPRKTTPRGCQRRAAASTVRASPLHARHHEAQKCRRTTRRRSDESFSLPSLPRRSRSKSGAVGFLPAATAAATAAPRCAVAMCTTSRTSSAATRAKAPIRPTLRMCVHRLQRFGGAQPQGPDEAAVVLVADLAGAVIELELAQRAQRAVALLERLEQIRVRRHRVGRVADERPRGERRAREQQQRQEGVEDHAVATFLTANSWRTSLRSSRASGQSATNEPKRKTTPESQIRS